MTRFVKISGILVLIVGLGVASWIFFNPPSYDITRDPEVEEVITLRRGTILSTINASGRIEPRHEVRVEFGISGVVAEVFVKRGQHVTKGTLLARLRTDDLELAVRRAEVELARARAQLEQLYEPPDEVDVAAARAEVARAQAQLEALRAAPHPKDLESAQAAVASARANLKRVLKGLDENEITVRAAQLRRAEIALKQAQWAYDQIAYRGDVGASPQAAQLEQATIDYEAAKANYLLAAKGADEADIAAAEAQVAQAEAALDRLVRGPSEAEQKAAEAQLAQAEAALHRLLRKPSPNEVTIAQAAVDAAQLAVEQARVNLASALLVAPIDGVVTESNLKVGENSTPGRAQGVVISDLSAYRITVEVDEVDIGRVRVGQKVAIAVDAFPDARLQGMVAEIAPRATSAAGGVVSYQVTIALSNPEAPLLLGLSADATLEVERLEDVLLVPNRAVSVDRSRGEPRYFVEKLTPDGSSTPVEIQLGLRSETHSQVLHGLAEGDQVVVRKISRREQLQRLFRPQE
ncbi:MAG: efflux RND transporter periplasmic adaptor subunit [Anaerolineae bacterium]|nr:efflux RND transporter periplasmic adaptor subunit [Anaerolineae bacterium]MDW8070332.1 efflux RND transporter periplasmic adaptor subunit [Anaerolineae bacterium]